MGIVVSKERNEAYLVDKKFQWRRVGLPIIVCMTSLYGIACLYLYLQQAVQPLDYNNRYFQSDLPYHISMIIDDGWYYSFTAYAYQLLYWMAGKNTWLIAVLLAVVSFVNVFLTDKLLRVLMGQKERTALTLGGALMLNLVMPFFMELAGVYRYVSYQSGNLWHNSTYLCMRLFAVASILAYMKIEEKYREKIEWKQWLQFALLLVVATGIKPSFLTVFAPAMALKLLWDLCHKVPFKQIFLFGCAVLPACGVVLWQNAVLFGEETGQGFALKPWFTFSLHADRPKLAVLCSIAFPLVVLLFSIKELWKDRKYFFAWLITGIGFMEALLLAETGSRANDGNFLWGYCFAIFYIYVVSFVKWLDIWKREKYSTVWKILFLVAGLVLFYQLYCGVYFFLRLLGGETYFMLK
ncbi:MAG: hypothetical protein IKK33_09930 [Lachnospiraceae bacterium]|nr:hypothetical protein [Lachnospiraceae bacterium]